MKFVDSLDEPEGETVTRQPTAWGDMESTHNHADITHNIDGSITVNGKVIPKLVADQLPGTPIEFFNSGLLDAAIQACAIDSRLIHNPGGMDFLEELSSDGLDQERLEQLERDRLEDEAQEQAKSDEDELTSRGYLAKNVHGDVHDEMGRGTVYASHSSHLDKEKERRERRKPKENDAGKSHSPLSA